MAQVYLRRCRYIFYIVFLLEHDALSANQSYNYEKLNGYGLGKPIIFNLDNPPFINQFKNIKKFQKFGYQYPEKLPTKKPVQYVRPPYRSVYQGTRNHGDRRVYNKNFQYPPKTSPHHLYCEGVFDCTLSHIAVETNGSTPIILRGGAGYQHFTVVIRAPAFQRLAGTVRAYCRRAAQASRENNTMFRRFRRYY